MGKKTHCSYCIEFHRKNSRSRNWGCRGVEVPGCDWCHQRHERELSDMTTRETSLTTELDQKQNEYTTELAKLQAKYARALMDQNNIHEQLLSESKRKSSLEITELKADNTRQRSKVQFLQARRDAVPGDQVLLIVGGVEIKAHCNILAARSPVFNKMIQGDTSGKSIQVIEIDDVLSPVLEATVDFCYSGEVTFSELVPPEELIKVAHRFKLRLLKTFCEDELCRGLSVNNMPQMLRLSQRFGARRLEEEAGIIFKENFDTLKSRVYKNFEGPECKSIPDSDSDAEVSGSGGFE